MSSDENPSAQPAPVSQYSQRWPPRLKPSTTTSTRPGVPAREDNVRTGDHQPDMSTISASKSHTSTQ